MIVRKRIYILFCYYYQFLFNIEFIKLKAFLKDFVILLGCFGFIIENNKDIK